MKIYTKTGDDGTTALFGGERVSKDNLRLEAYGTVDELNAVLGMAQVKVSSDLNEFVNSLQNDLFILGADLASPLGTKSDYVPRVDKKMIEELEKSIDKYSDLIPELKQFILPGGSEGSGILHFARTVCRRAERNTVTLAKSIEINVNVIVYLNRLSDLLFVLSRYENAVRGIEDIPWKK